MFQNMELFRITYFFLVFLKTCVAQNLVVVEARAKFPTTITAHVAIYDGGESILILGGYDHGDSIFLNTIYSFNIQEDNLQLVANFPIGVGYGLASFDKNGNVYYMGGDNRIGYSEDIFKLDLKEGNMSLVGHLYDIYAYGTTTNFNIDKNEIQLFSGYYNEVTCFDLDTLHTCGSKSLFGDYEYLIRTFEQNANAYAFGNTRDNSIEKINLETLESVPLEGFGFRSDYAAVVSDGIFGYIIGGYDAKYPVNGIIRYDPQTNEHTFLQVENFSVTGIDAWYLGEAVYVEKFHRIYMFGGVVNSELQDKIWYIDLEPSSEEPSTSTQSPILTSTMNPDIFNCDKKPTGMYPHPYDCAKFIGCHDEVLEVYECPPPLLFSPITLSCTFPEEVDCSINCSGKPNGMYPHPHSCELFIACHDEVLEVYKCPEPLLFDPEEKKCTFPEDVSCNVK